ncbi:MAG: hypothetical protein KKE96_02385 [Candidatus Altiarchaeota archaeon]|nr:hypothetical protein [Candidatus Altiarchaeota archaeon]
MSDRIVFKDGADDSIIELMEKYGLTDDLSAIFGDMDIETAKPKDVYSGCSYDIKAGEIFLSTGNSGGPDAFGRHLISYDDFDKRLNETNYKQIENTIMDVAQGIVSFRDLDFVLQQRLDIPQETAKMLAKDIIKKLPYLIEKES